MGGHSNLNSLYSDTILIRYCFEVHADVCVLVITASHHTQDHYV